MLSQIMADNLMSDKPYSAGIVNHSLSKMDNLKKHPTYRNFISFFEKNKVKFKLLIDFADSSSVIGSMTT